MLCPARSAYDASCFRWPLLCKRPLLVRRLLLVLLMVVCIICDGIESQSGPVYLSPVSMGQDAEASTMGALPRVGPGALARLRMAPATRALPAETSVLVGQAEQVTHIMTLEEYLERQAEIEEQLKRRLEGLNGTLEQSAAAKRRTDTTQHTNQTGSQPTTAAKPIPQHWQVRSLLNFTHDYPLPHSQIIYGYLWPLVAGITLFTNLMIVFVLTQRDMRTPTNIVLSAIAIADIIPITGPVPWFIYLFAMGNEKQVLYPPMACYFYQHSTRSISEIFYFLSTWLNLLLAALDYMAACWPELTKKYFRIKAVVLEIIAMSLLALLLNLPQALKVVFKPVKFYYRGELTWGCRALQARWFKDLVGEYVALYDDIFTAIIVVFVDGGPALGLIILTALLIKQLKRQRIRGHILMEQARTASKRRRERYRQQEIESSARVMIFVLLAFLAVKIPFATTYTLMIIQSRFDIHFVENLVDFQKAITITDLVFVLSYPINFTIFCCCSKKFRHKCGQLLSECNNSRRDSRLASRFMRSFSGSLDGSSFSAPNSRQTMHTNKRRTLESLASLDLKSAASWASRRRQDSNVSDDTAPSWPGVPGPAPLKLERYAHHLPRILTTECGSMGGPAADDGPLAAPPDMSDRAERDVTEIERVHHSSSSELRQAGARHGFSGRTTTTTTTPTPARQEHATDADEEQGGSQRRSSGRGRELTGLVSIRKLAAHLAPHRYLSTDHLHVAQPGSMSRADHTGSSSLWPNGDKKRAQSLSNSRLYNLPSSTGQLANVLLRSLEEPLRAGASLRSAFGLSNDNNYNHNDNNNPRWPANG